MGGDLRGVDQQLDYLATLGVNTIYFNPIFDAGSNHSYDTQDYTRIDPYFGTQKDWENLVKHADELGIRIVLDGVFNHLSSRQPHLRPLPPLPDRRRLRVGRFAVPRLVRVHARIPTASAPVRTARAP